MFSQIQKPSNEEIKKAFAYYKNYFPKKQLPTKINYCITGLNYSAFISDSEQIGVSLDMYLNKDTLYNQIFPNYIARQIKERNDLSKCNENNL
jgi:hypothetical protein